jgi:hypothetical protein
VGCGIARRVEGMRRRSWRGLEVVGVGGTRAVGMDGRLEADGGVDLNGLERGHPVELDGMSVF